MSGNVTGGASFHRRGEAKRNETETGLPLSHSSQETTPIAKPFSQIIASS